MKCVLEKLSWTWDHIIWNQTYIQRQISCFLINKINCVCVHCTYMHMTWKLQWGYNGAWTGERGVESVRVDVGKIHFLLHVECNLNRHVYAYTLTCKEEIQMHKLHTHMNDENWGLFGGQQEEGRGVRRGRLRGKYNGIYIWKSHTEGHCFVWKI